MKILFVLIVMVFIAVAGMTVDDLMWVYHNNNRSCLFFVAMFHLSCLSFIGSVALHFWRSRNETL